jgi:hypothetical protein
MVRRIHICYADTGREGPVGASCLYIAPVRLRGASAEAYDGGVAKVSHLRAGEI